MIWMAEHKEPIRCRGALKIIKVGRDTRHAVASSERLKPSASL